MKTQLKRHYNPLDIYHENDEVLFDGHIFICTPAFSFRMGITNISPYDTRNWKKKEKTTEERLMEINEQLAKKENDTALLKNIIDSTETDEDFLEVCKLEILNRACHEKIATWIK